MSHLSLDARAILEYLNELGYRNISAEQLKEFIKDLRKLIKYDESLGLKAENDKNYFHQLFQRTTASYRHKLIKENVDKKGSSEELWHPAMRQEAQKIAKAQAAKEEAAKSKQSTPRIPYSSDNIEEVKERFKEELFAHLNDKPRIKGGEEPKAVLASKARAVPSLRKENIETRYHRQQVPRNVNLEALTIKNTSSKDKRTDPPRPARSKEKFTKPKQQPRMTSPPTPRSPEPARPISQLQMRDPLEVKHGPPAANKPLLRNSASCSALVPRAALKPRARKPIQNDPVALYRYYQQEWSYFKKQIPDGNSHFDVRWNIRRKLLDPH